VKSQYIIIALLAVIVGLSATIGIIALDSDIFDDDKITPDTVAGDISHTEIQIHALIQTHKIQSDLLEGVEEAFAYIILDDENEKKEFHQKMNDFDNSFANYIKFDPVYDDADAPLVPHYLPIVQARNDLMASAIIMFDSFESGDLDMKTVLAFEKNIDELVPIIDRLIESEIAQINGNLHEIAEKVNELSDDD